MAPAGSTEPPPRSSRPGGHSTTKRPETDNHSGVHVNFDADDFTAFIQLLRDARFPFGTVCHNGIPRFSNNLPHVVRNVAAGLVGLVIESSGR